MRCAVATYCFSKSAFVQASDEMNALRNELSGVHQRPRVRLLPSQIQARNLAAIGSGASGRNGLKVAGRWDQQCGEA